jgi:hypothetical protein
MKALDILFKENIQCFQGQLNYIDFKEFSPIDKSPASSIMT